MSGIMATVASNAVNARYTNGLWDTTTGADLSPIDGSVFVGSGSSSINRTWIGYFRSTSTGTISLSLQTTAFSSGSAFATTTGRLWFGATAVSGFNDGNANIVAVDNQTSSTNFSMAQGVYYPVRINWTGDYIDFGGFGSSAQGSISFLAGGTSDVSGRIFYNALTNGF